MSERQKLFLSCVFSVAGLIWLFHAYPSCLIVAFLSLGTGAVAVGISEWYQPKSPPPKYWENSTPEPSELEDEQLLDYILSIEFDELTSDICLDLNIGDRTCKYNAHSPYIRCAIDPAVETCEGCRHYEPISPNPVDPEESKS